MPAFASFLDRFRRLLAPPGRPGEALGVPASGDDRSAELEPRRRDYTSASSAPRQHDPASTLA